MKTILVPVDFSPVTRSVLAAAANLAQACRGRLVLFHAARPSASLFSCQMGGMDVTQAVVESEAAAAHQLEALAAEIPGAVAVNQRGAGIPAQEILRAALENAADLIVIGSHGHGALHDLLLGSTARGVMKHAPCPVLVVPSALAKSIDGSTADAPEQLLHSVD